MSADQLGETGTSARLRRNQVRDTRQELINAAVDLYVETKYHNLRITDITRGAGVSMGTFYLYFHDKRELLVAYFQHVLERFDSVEAQAADGGLDHLSRLALRMKATLDPKDRWTRVITFLRMAADSTDAEIAVAARETHMRLIAQAKADLAEAMRSGDVREFDPELVALACVGMQEVLIWATELEGSRDTDRILAFLLDVYERAFMHTCESGHDVQVDRILEKALAAGDSVNPLVAVKPSGNRKIDTREKLIQAAVELFADVGYQNLRIGDITDYAGVAKGTFYLHFASKEELLLAYFERVRHRTDAMEALADTSSDDFYWRFAVHLRAAVDPASRWGKVMSFVRVSANSQDPEIASAARALHVRMLESAKKDFVQGMERGILRRTEPDLAILAWGGMLEMLAWRVQQDDSYDVDTVVAFLAKVYARAFMTCDGESAVSRDEMEG